MAAEHVQRMGRRMAERREELGLSQEAVARALPGRVSNQQVSKWERGIHRPGDDTLERLAEILKVSVAYFLADAPDRSSTPDPFVGSDDHVARLEAKIDGLETKLDDLLALLKPSAETLAEVLEAEADRLDEQRKPPASRSKRTRRSEPEH